jgi:hypothetical protein
MLCLASQSIAICAEWMGTWPFLFGTKAHFRESSRGSAFFTFFWETLFIIEQKSHDLESCTFIDWLSK